jgi:hypothetical protein
MNTVSNPDISRNIRDGSIVYSPSKSWLLRSGQSNGFAGKISLGVFE